MTDLECLQTIEFLVSVNEDPKCEEREQILHDVYATVHSHLKHSCHYVHDEWRRQAKEFLKSAVMMGFTEESIDTTIEGWSPDGKTWYPSEPGTFTPQELKNEEK
jgi:hypothetical protein